MNETEIKQNPLLDQVNAIFVHVTDMPKAVEWYCRLLGKNKQYEGSADDRTVFGIKMGNGITILLDSMRRERPDPSGNALFYLNAPTMKEAYDFIRALGIQPIDDDDKELTVQDISNDPFHFRIKDPFGNVIIIHKGSR